MRTVVTGCAGFIGSRLSEALVADGATVVGIDAFTPYYDRSDKERNLRALEGEQGFSLEEVDLSTARLAPLFADADAIFHLAAQPGVRASFTDFDHYVRHNLLATQRVFEAAKDDRVPRVVWASSSSVYGDAKDYPLREGRTALEPLSPYGATKKACEDLARIYRARGCETVAMRYFTVYGPRQRPDMATRRLVDAALDGLVFPQYGDGQQSRDYTFVDDIVDATVRAASAENPSAIYNVGGGEEATLASVIALVEELSGHSVDVDRREASRGDVRRTAADTSRARTELGWTPRTSLRDGIAAQVRWATEVRSGVA